MDSIHSNTMRVARQTANNLQERNWIAEEKSRSLMSSVQDIYNSESDPNYRRAKCRLVGIVTYHHDKERQTQTKILQDEAVDHYTDHSSWEDQWPLEEETQHLQHLLLGMEPTGHAEPYEQPWELLRHYQHCVPEV